jgi:KDO2-lipid IV(A) lauroyltransferase
MVQACADILGDTIIRHTEDWHMLQRVFIDDLDLDLDAPAGRRAAEQSASTPAVTS